MILASLNLTTLESGTVVGSSFLFVAAWYWTFYGIGLSFRAFKSASSMGDL